MYRVRRLKIGKRSLLDQLALECGRVYSQTLVYFWRTVRHKGLWLKPRHLMRWDGEQYEAIATYVCPDPQPLPAGRPVGIDLGEVHVAVTSDGLIVNGRYLRSLLRWRNKTIAAFQAKMDTKVKGSRRWRRLKQAKDKQLRRLDNQIRDVLHKATTGLVSMLAEEGVQTLVIGDVRDIRRDLDYGSTANQKLHQWPHGRTRWYLSYKAEAHGMRWVLQDEAYTSQTCPSCGRRKPVNGRVYRCSCGFVGHRDHVGAVNILTKYLGCVPVAGLMARPTGWHYQAHARVARGFELREAARL